MGRGRYIHHDLPKGLHVRISAGKSLYYYAPDGTGRRIPLGDDKAAAVETACLARNADARCPKQATIARKTGISLLSAGEIVARARQLDEQCGIYFLINGDEIVYVGMSTNVMRRLERHVKEAEIAFDSYYWTPCLAKDLHRLERAYIHALEPKANSLICKLPAPESKDE